VALNSAERIGKRRPKCGVVRSHLFSDLGGESPEAPKDIAAPATRPRPRDRQRPSTASKESACTTGRAGRTDRKDRANGRCLFFAGRQTVSTPTRDISIVSLDPSQKLTKALPRHLSVHKTPSRITQKRSRATMRPAGDILSSFQGGSEFASSGNSTGEKALQMEPAIRKKMFPGQLNWNQSWARRSRVQQPREHCKMLFPITLPFD
jgi:hypothetical protein